MITICDGESTKDVKYEIKKIQYVQCGSGLNKITISPKTKDGKYETVTLNIWGDKLEGIKAHDWDTKEKGNDIIIRKVRGVELQEYNGKQYLSITVPSNGYSIVFDGVASEDTPIKQVATEEFLPF